MSIPPITRRQAVKAAGAVTAAYLIAPTATGPTISRRPTEPLHQRR
jgi:hypothetical protein